GGVRVVVTDRETIRPVTVGLAIARVLRSRHRDQFRPEAIQNLLVNRATMWAFLRNESLDRLVAWTEMERNSFLNRRAAYLISKKVLFKHPSRQPQHYSALLPFYTIPPCGGWW